MKQPKKLTREQKECLSAHYLNCKVEVMAIELDSWKRWQMLIFVRTSWSPFLILSQRIYRKPLM